MGGRHILLQEYGARPYTGINSLPNIFFVTSLVPSASTPPTKGFISDMMLWETFECCMAHMSMILLTSRDHSPTSLLLYTSFAPKDFKLAFLLAL